MTVKVFDLIENHDEWAILEDLGFESIPGHRRLMICPRCYVAVLADVAEKHWWCTHQQIVYYAHNYNFPWGDFKISYDEEIAAFYAQRSPHEIVYGVVEDR